MIRGLSSGILGGVSGTVLMDIVMVATFLIAGYSGDTFFVMIGDKLGRGPAIGIGLHILIGLSVGALFATVVQCNKALKIDTRRKGLALGILVGAITIPVGCIPLAIWVGEPIVTVVSFSAIPHMVYGITLGLVVTYGALSIQTPTSVGSA